MKISKISVYQLDLPLTKPYWLSGGRLKFEKLDSTFVRIDTDEDVNGWGEGCPWGNTYLPAHGPGIRAGIETLAPSLLGQDPRSLLHVNRVMDIHLPGHPYVKSPIDMACWDILGKVSGMPLWQLMGGASAEPVLVNSSISTGTPEEMIDLIKEASAKGYKVHSAKVGGDDPQLDIHRIEGISSA
ncbi:MAG: mandelate racemase, partial [Pseudomonadota bacterium]